MERGARAFWFDNFNSSYYFAIATFNRLFSSPFGFFYGSNCDFVYIFINFQNGNTMIVADKPYGNRENKMIY